MHYLFRTHLLREQHKIKELILCTLDGLITGVDPYRMDPPHLLLFCRGEGGIKNFREAQNHLRWN